MKITCKQCGHKDNNAYPIDFNADRDIYDWYVFECDGCGYTCSFSISTLIPMMIG